MRIGIKVLDRSAADRLSKAPSEVDQEISKEFDEEIGPYVVARAKSIVPVRTGYLRSSITKDNASTSVNGIRGVRIGANASYAATVEFGTRRWRGKPFLRPALAQSIGYIERRISEAVQRVFNRGG